MSEEEKPYESLTVCLPTRTLERLNELQRIYLMPPIFLLQQILVNKVDDLYEAIRCQDQRIHDAEESLK